MFILNFKTFIRQSSTNIKKKVYCPFGENSIGPQLTWFHDWAKLNIGLSRNFGLRSEFQKCSQVQLHINPFIQKCVAHDSFQIVIQRLYKRIEIIADIDLNDKKSNFYAISFAVVLFLMTELFPFATLLRCLFGKSLQV